MRNLIDFGDMSREEWEQLYARASQIIDAPEKFIDRCSALQTPILPPWPRARP